MRSINVKFKSEIRLRTRTKQFVSALTCFDIFWQAVQISSQLLHTDHGLATLKKIAKQVSTDTNCFVRVRNRISELNLTVTLLIFLCRRIYNVLSILGTVKTLELPIVIILLFLLHYQTLLFKLRDIPLQLSLTSFYCTLFYYIFNLSISLQSGLIKLNWIKFNLI